MAPNRANNPSSDVTARDRLRLFPKRTHIGALMLTTAGKGKRYGFRLFLKLFHRIAGSVDGCSVVQMS